MASHVAVSVGLFSSVQNPYPIFQNISQIETTLIDGVKTQPYTMANGHVNCTLGERVSLQNRIDTIVAKMEQRASAGYVLGQCLRIGGQAIANTLISITGCLSWQKHDQKVVRACFNSIVRRPYAPNDECEQVLNRQHDVFSYQTSVVQGCNAYSAAIKGKEGEFAKEAAYFAEKFAADFDKL